MMNLRVISMGSFLIEVTEEIPGMEEVLDPHGDGMEAGARAQARMIGLVTRLREVVEIIKPVVAVAAAGLQQKKAVAMIG